MPRGLSSLLRCALGGALVFSLLSCHATQAVDDKLLSAASASRSDVERYTQWVERTLRGHDSPATRAEVLFSPLRLDESVLDAHVAVGQPEQRYALHDDGTPPEDGAAEWTKLSGRGYPQHARWGSLPDPQEDTRTPCVWLRVDARSAGVVHGFRVWVAYRVR